MQPDKQGMQYLITHAIKKVWFVTFLLANWRSILEEGSLVSHLLLSSSSPLAKLTQLTAEFRGLCI